jgi:hypothetical protein
MDEDGNEGFEVERYEKHCRETDCLRKFLVSAPLLEMLHIELDIVAADSCR